MGGRSTARPATARATPLDRSTPLVKAISAVASLVALLGSLLYYFGWVRSEYQARAFGADASVFGMSSQELVIRSADVLFLPALAVLLASVLATTLHTRLIAMAQDDVRRGTVLRVVGVLRRAWLISAVVAAVLLALVPSTGRLVLPFLFAAGLSGTWYAAVLRSRIVESVPPIPTVLFLLLAALLAVSLFWMTERVARIGGEARVDGIKTRTGQTLPGVTVFSRNRLQLAGGPVTERALEDPEAAYRYRYDGAFLLQRSGGSYFLITDGWPEGEGRLIVLPEDASTRLEFGPGR